MNPNLNFAQGVATRFNPAVGATKWWIGVDAGVGMGYTTRHDDSPRAQPKVYEQSEFQPESWLAHACHNTTYHAPARLNLVGVLIYPALGATDGV